VIRIDTRMKKKRRGSKKRNVRAQISAFILIGLVIMTVFFFAYYVKRQIQVQAAEQKIDAAAEILQSTPVLNYYVTLCLKDSIEGALLLAGRQGGNIYIDQGGLADRDSIPIFKYKGDNVTYGMTSIDSQIPNAMRLTDDPTYPLPYEYPCIKTVQPISYRCPYDYLFGIPTESSIEINGVQFNPQTNAAKFFPFSQSNLPLLCIPNGPNDVDMGIFPFPCPSGAYGPDSIQQQIKVYAEKRMQNCTNFSAIKQMINFNITANPPQILPIMGENDMVIKATYPINITIGTYGSVRLFEFEVKLPVRLKKIYGLAQFLVENDDSYLDFNMTSDFDSKLYYTPYWDPYIKVEKFCPKCDLEGGEKDSTDIFQINDSASNIMGNDYYFRFAVENRDPALDWIHKTSPEEQQFDYIIQEGDEIIIEPNGYDPDDNDDLFYFYELWKQDYDEVFNPFCCNEINPDSSVICKNDPWKCIEKAPAASLQLCMDDYLQQDTNVWTTSNMYKIPNPINPSNTFRSSNYLTKTTDPGKIGNNPNSEDNNPVHYPCNKDEQTGEWLGTAYSRDLGPHNATVKVCDGHGKCDWQSVLIMVTDIPRPVISIINDYGTEDASLEDPFILDASKSNIFSVVDRYLWKDVIPGLEPEFMIDVAYSETENGRLRIPHPFGDYDITTIKVAGNFFRQTGPQTLSLTIGSQTDTKEINVKECIPYRSADSPYPYNKGDNPFMGNHACCEDTGTYSDASKICYQDGEYGAIRYFEENKYTGLGMPRLVYWHLDEGLTQDAPSLNSNYGNDIFFRKFERHCSGDRGNICSGNGQEDMYPSASCNDLEGHSWQDERCQGPPQDVSAASDRPCIDYLPGQTFESVEGVNKMGVGIVNGYCSDTPKCTNGIDYRLDGPFKCQKAVCEDGHCSKPYTTDAMKCMCSSASCSSQGADQKCDVFSYDDMVSGGRCLPSKEGFCDSTCHFSDPDESMAACSGCSYTWKWTGWGSSETNVARDKCCGDETANEFHIIAADNTDACCDNRDANGQLLHGNECVIAGVCKNRLPAPEVCNGQDDDCNPYTADGSGEPKPSNENQEGVCLNSKKSCSGMQGWKDDYSGIPGYQVAETNCDDGLDNDCDGWEDCQDDGCKGLTVCTNP